MIPLKFETKRPITFAHMFSTWVNADHVVSAIRVKIKRYKSIKKTDLPYVVVVALEDKNLDLNDIRSVLYSTDLFTSKQGGSVQNTRLSAVITLRKKLSGDGLWIHNFTVFHNPFAKNRFPDNIFSEYAQFTEAMGWTKPPEDLYELL